MTPAHAADIPERRLMAGVTCVERVIAVPPRALLRFGLVLFVSLPHAVLPRDQPGASPRDEPAQVPCHPIRVRRKPKQFHDGCDLGPRVTPGTAGKSKCPMSTAMEQEE